MHHDVSAIHVFIFAMLFGAWYAVAILVAGGLLMLGCTVMRTYVPSYTRAMTIFAQPATAALVVGVLFIPVALVPGIDPLFVVLFIGSGELAAGAFLAVLHYRRAIRAQNHTRAFLVGLFHAPISLMIALGYGSGVALVFGIR